MNKAILVIDMPRNCGECMLARLCNGDRVMCSIDRLSSRTLSDAMGNKADWCPLKEIPDKKAVWGERTKTVESSLAYHEGWNDCIDAILEGSIENDGAGSN